MPLSFEMTLKSAIALKEQFLKELDAAGIERLVDINSLAAKNDIFLSGQTPNVLHAILDQVKDPNQTTGQRYETLVKIMNEETAEERKRHLAAGRFDSLPLYRRAPRDQMQAEDMQQAMPKSHAHIEVFCAVHQSMLVEQQFDFSASMIEALEIGVRTALKNQAIQHIIVPIGPDHWRVACVTKPTQNNPKYELELFDPYGPKYAHAIQKFMLDLLIKLGICDGDVSIKSTGPTKPQQDAYACGDFACAYSHQKMKEFGANQAAYNQEFIETLENYGNQDDALRKVTRRATGESAEVGLSLEENSVFEATLDKQKRASNSYRQEIASLIRNRQVIFAKADAAIEKDKQNTPLIDEELAAKLQAEEFTKVGLKRR